MDFVCYIQHVMDWSALVCPVYAGGASLALFWGPVVTDV